VGGTSHPTWLNGANISDADCPGLYNSIYDTSVPSIQSLLCNGAVNALGGCCVGGSSAINAGLYLAPPDSDWDSWGIDSWSSGNMKESTTALQSVVGPGETVTSSDGQLYLQSSYNAMANWLSGAGYSQVDANSQQDYNSKSKVPFFTFFHLLMVGVCPCGIRLQRWPAWRPGNYVSTKFSGKWRSMRNGSGCQCNSSHTSRQ
jgi:cellobiose dehydrogenase (acceptor)